MPTGRQADFDKKAEEIEMKAIEDIVKLAEKLEAPHLYLSALGPILVAYELRVSRRER